MRESGTHTLRVWRAAGCVVQDYSFYNNHGNEELKRLNASGLSDEDKKKPAELFQFFE